MSLRDGLGHTIWDLFYKLGIPVLPAGYTLENPTRAPQEITPDAAEDADLVELRNSVQRIYQMYKEGEIAPCVLWQQREEAKQKYQLEIIHEVELPLLVPVGLLAEAHRKIEESKSVPESEGGGTFFYKPSNGAKVVTGYEHKPNVLDVLGKDVFVFDVDKKQDEIGWIKRLREASEGKGSDADNYALLAVRSTLRMPNFEPVREDLQRFIFEEDLEKLGKVGTRELLPNFDGLYT